MGIARMKDRLVEDATKDSFSGMDNACPIPLLILALIEARKHRWNKSVAINRDAGEECIVEWFRLYWRDWFRQHWVEHLNGQQYYEGFGSDEFNVTETAKEDKALVHTLVNFLTEQGNEGENLGIILWARDFGKDMNKVLKFLRRININNKRFSWDSDTLKIICMALREADKYKWIESQKAGRDLGEGAIFDWFQKVWPIWKKENF